LFFAFLRFVAALVFGCHPSPQAEDLLFAFVFGLTFFKSIPFIYHHLQLFSAKTAQKSRVKPQNHLTATNKTRSSLKFSLVPTAIMNI
jgi:hypothetical protein